MERYDAWISRAKSSHELSKAHISNIIRYEDLCYQAQQAVEKAFKGLLIYFGAEPEFTHNIGTLLKGLKKHTEIDDDIMDAISLTDYAVQTRYPGEYGEITKDEYEKSIKIAKDCIDWVESVRASAEKGKGKS